MKAPRLYLPVPLAEGCEVALDERAHHHAIQVLRLCENERLVLFNGEGGEFAATLVAVRRRETRARIDERLPARPRPRLPILLAQGISRGERMDFALQKAAELGVTAIRPLVTQRVQGHDERRIESRLAHWQGVLIAACEQSGRDEIPPLLAPLPLDDFLRARTHQGLALLLDPRAEQGLNAIDQRPDSITLLIGPEGGFEDGECARAGAAGFTPLRLGPRILRTETAAVAAIAAVQTRWGDIG